jgi:trigger factor
VKLTVERLPESQVLLDIVADDDEFAKAMDRAYRQVAKQVAVPGFRKGKAPRNMIERLYGRGVFLEEANKELMTDLYRRALDQEALRPVGEPEVEVVGTEPLAFKVTVPIFPTVEPGAYGEVRIEPVDAAVDEAAVDEAVEALRRAESPWVDPAGGGLEVGADLVLAPKSRTPRDDDQVTIDYTVREGDEAAEEPVEDAVFVLGESGLLDQLEERLKGMEVGESAEFDIAFPEDDLTVDQDLRGKTLAYAVTLKGLKERDLVPLDDDFARNAAEVETLEELRGQLRNDLHQRKTAEARAEVLNQTIAAMAEAAQVELPASMIDEAVDEDLQAMRNRLQRQGLSLDAYLRLTGQSEDEVKAEQRPAAERRLRNSLVLREIAKREGIAVDEADLDEEVGRLAAAAAAAPDPQRVEQLYRSDYFRGVLRNDLFERRLSDRLLEIATEGRGPVLNGWVEPEPAPESGTESAEGGTTEAASSAAGGDDLGPTLGTMPGQPGDLAEAGTATVAIEEVAAEPDAAQAAAAGHEAESAAVSAQAPDEAVTPEEAEAQGEPGQGGSLAQPTY